MRCYLSLNLGFMYVHFFCLDTKETNQRKSQGLHNNFIQFCFLEFARVLNLSWLLCNQDFKQGRLSSPFQNSKKRTAEKFLWGRSTFYYYLVCKLEVVFQNMPCADLYSPFRAKKILLLSSNYTLIITHYSLLITNYTLLITHYSLLITHYALFITHYALFI